MTIEEQIRLCIYNMKNKCNLHPLKRSWSEHKQTDLKGIIGRVGGFLFKWNIG